MATQTEVNGRATYRHSMPITAEDLLYPPRPVEMVSAEVQTNGGLGQPPPPINTNNAPLNQLPSASRLPGMCNCFVCWDCQYIMGPLLLVKKHQTLRLFGFFCKLTYRTLRLQTSSVPYWRARPASSPATDVKVGWQDSTPTTSHSVLVNAARGQANEISSVTKQVHSMPGDFFSSYTIW